MFNLTLRPQLSSLYTCTFAVFSRFSPKPRSVFPPMSWPFHLYVVFFLYTHSFVHSHTAVGPGSPLTYFIKGILGFLYHTCVNAYVSL